MDFNDVSKISSAKTTLPLQKKYSLTQEHAKQLRVKHWKIFLPTEISAGYLRTKSKYQRAEKQKSNFMANKQLTFPKEIKTNKQSLLTKELNSYGNGKNPLNAKDNLIVEQVDLCNYNIKFAEASKQNQNHNRKNKIKSNEGKIKHKTYPELKTTLCNPTPNQDIQQCYCLNNYGNVELRPLQSVLDGNSSGSLLSRYPFYNNFGVPAYSNEVHPEPYNYTTYQRGGAVVNWNSQESRDKYFNNFAAPHRFTWLNSYEDYWKLNYYHYENARRHYQWDTPGRNYYFNPREPIYVPNFNSNVDFAFNPWNLSYQHY